jgi:hypothetical protein
MAKTAEKTRAKRERVCPLCLLADTLEAAREDFQESAVGKHICNAEREILLAVRAAVDRCIDSCAPGGKEKEKGRVQKVKVE